MSFQSLNSVLLTARPRHFLLMCIAVGVQQDTSVLTVFGYLVVLLFVLHKIEVAYIFETSRLALSPYDVTFDKNTRMSVKHTNIPPLTLMQLPNWRTRPQKQSKHKSKHKAWTSYTLSDIQVPSVQHQCGVLFGPCVSFNLQQIWNHV